MSRFNKSSAAAIIPTAPNLAGGKGFQLNAEEELASILLTSFMGDQYYRSANETTAKLLELLPKCDPKFVAKLTLYTRNEVGLRSVTHFVAAWMGRNVRGHTWLKSFYKQLFRRPDDMLETVAALTPNLHPLPNAMKRAIKETLQELSPHALAKYRGDGKQVKMVDLVRLCEPKYNDQIQLLLKGELKVEGTWESDISAAGGDEELTAEAWGNLLLKNKMKYLALIRNARNIFEKAPAYIDTYIQRLMDFEELKKSLVMPHQVYVALQIVKGTKDRKLIQAFNKVLDASVVNVPEFSGRSLIAVDTSGSMDSRLAGTDPKRAKPTDMTCKQTAALFAAAMYKKNNSEVMVFADRAFYLKLNPDDTLDSICFTIANALNGGTDFTSITAAMELKRPIDRCFILSDMQAWVEHQTGYYINSKPAFPQAWKAVCNVMGCTPSLYTIDLSGYGTTQMPLKDVYRLYGFSSKLFDFVNLLEKHGTHGIVKAIKGINIDG